jgi:hypothetical protein
VEQDVSQWLSDLVGGAGCDGREVPAAERFDAIVLDLADPEYADAAGQ